ncbi:hypothetical protein ABK040_008558 [Willaertia magna]
MSSSTLKAGNNATTNNNNNNTKSGSTKTINLPLPTITTTTPNNTTTTANSNNTSTTTNTTAPNNQPNTTNNTPPPNNNAANNNNTNPNNKSVKENFLTKFKKEVKEIIKEFKKPELVMGAATQFGEQKDIEMKVELKETNFRRFERIMRRTFVDRFTIPELSIIASFWLFLVFFATVYNYVTVTYRVAILTFKQDATYAGVFALLDILMDFVIWFDIFLSFMKRYAGRDGIYVYDFKLTSKNYVKSKYFILDIVSALPIDYFILIADTRWGVWARMNRIIRILRFGFYFGQFELFYTFFSTNIIAIGQYIFIFFITTHALTCIWYIIVVTDPEQTVQIWTQKQDILSDVTFGHFSRYVRGFLWCLTSMTGYGGTSPVTLPQVIFAQVVNLVGVVLFIVVIGTVGSIVEDLGQEKSERLQQLNALQQYMTYRKIPEGIRSKIERYYQFVWKARSGWDEQVVLGDLPWYLQTEIYLSMNQELLEKVSLFKVEGATKTFITSMVMALRPQVVLPGSKVVKKGEIGREMYFILKGYVEVISEDNPPIVFATLKEGQFFGEISVVLDQTRNATVRAGTYCDLYVLTKESLKQIEEDFPLPVQKIREKAMERLNTPQKK